MKTILLAFSHFDTGGLQTLMLRIALWCKYNNIECHIIFEESDKYMKRCILDNKINYLESFNKHNIVDYVTRCFSSTDDILCITFELPEFIYFEHIFSAYYKDCNITHVIYNVSVGSMIYGREFKNVLGFLIYKFYSRIVHKYFQNGQVLFMDADTLNSAQNYYNFKWDRNKRYIYLLPMIINPEPLYGSSYDDKIIMTVSRATFPFKGYLISLIDIFEKMFKTYPILKLIIVSFGEDYDKLIKKINDLPDNVKKNVKLINGLSTKEISNILKSAYVYIGMGTTVLDAANEGIPSIVVCHHTMECVCVGMFSDNPEIIGKMGKGIPVEPLIESVIKMNREQYLACCKTTYQSLKKMYNIDDFMNDFIQIKINKRAYLNKIEWIIHKSLFFCRKLRRKILKI